MTAQAPVSTRGEPTLTPAPVAEHRAWSTRGGCDLSLGIEQGREPQLTCGRLGPPCRCAESPDPERLPP